MTVLSFSMTQQQRVHDEDVIFSVCILMTTDFSGKRKSSMFHPFAIMDKERMIIVAFLYGLDKQNDFDLTRSSMISMMSRMNFV